MGELIDLLDQLAEKYKFDAEEVKALGVAIASLKGKGKGPGPQEEPGEFEYGNQEEPEAPMEEPEQEG